MRYLVRSLAWLGLLSALGVGSSATSLLAQTQKPGEPRVLRLGERSPSQFRLFSDRDFAVGGFRLAGVWSGCTSNSSNITTPDQCWWPFGSTASVGAGNMPNWFDIFFYWAAPPSERDKHAAAVPSLANARGKGYTVNSALSAYSGEMLPHDGTLGPFHAGATSRDDGSCLDISDDRGPFTAASGEPMLAASDCPPTWGSGGWAGSRNVDVDGYLAYADMVGDQALNFDPWKVPGEFQRTDKFLGSFQTFGFFSDYSSDALFGSSVHRSYGNVIPASMGGDPAEDPSRSGWPLGLMAKLDAFSFAAPGLLNTAWYQITVTNNSPDVYGTPLDYDSVYMGLQPGWLTWDQGTSLYRDPSTNTVRGANFCQGLVNSSTQGTSGNGCGPGGDPAHPASAWGNAAPNGVGAGFDYGAVAIVVLKSPIGDIRNKLFNDVASPFFGKGDIDAWDDTITFNHGHMCGFHGCSAVLWNAPGSTAENSDYEQRQFGMVASIPNDVNGDRVVADIADHTMWDTFRWEEYPDRSQLDFNRWTPGGWDWNDDGVDDELAWDDCTDNASPQFDPFTGHSKNCSVSWSDTLPGGFGNVYSNRAAVVGVGPISMAAGDTVQWVVALVHAEDLAGIENDIAKAIDHYLAFYLGPEPAPSPAVTSVEIQPGGGNLGPDGRPEATATLYWDASAEDWDDPFLQKFLDDMLAADAETDLGRIRDLNPILEDTLRALIPNNVVALHIFKSCDGGGGFTDDADCFDDPATGGKFADVGWLPWQTLEPDEEGDFDNSISDNGIFGGRQFLYSIIAETRGLEISVKTGIPGNPRLDAADESIDTGDGTAASFSGALLSPVVASTVTITDGTQTVQDDGNGNLVGDVDGTATESNFIDYETGEFDVTFAAPPADGAAITATYQYTVFTCVAECGSQVLSVAPSLLPAIPTATSSPAVAAVYIPISQQSGFQDAEVTLDEASPDFIPFERMNVRPTTDEVTDGQYQLLFGDNVVVTETATVSATGATIDGYTVDVDGEVLATDGVVAVEGPFEETIVDDQRTRVWTFDALTAVLAEGDGTPLTVTAALGGGQTVPGRYFGLSNYPGFSFAVDNSVAGNFEGQFYLDENENRIGPLVEPSVTYLSSAASGVTAQGRYQVSWLDQPFGSGSPFPLDLRDPDGTREAVVASLEGRNTVVSSTDPDIASFLGLPAEALLAVNVPFEIDNITAGVGAATDVQVVITRSNKQSQILLGNPPDTLFVEVAETEWVPGDALILVEGSAPNFDIPFGTAILGCESATWLRESCNPVALTSRGGTGYIPAQPSHQLRLRYFQTITTETQYTFSVSSAVSGRGLVDNREAIRAALDSVRVVPNPFVMFTRYSTSGGTDRIIFTHSPPRGVLRVFSVSGQFVQEIRWEPDDLNGRGDLWFNLRTREGNEMAAGLYLYVMTALGDDGGEIGTTRGKFVLIK